MNKVGVRAHLLAGVAALATPHYAFAQAAESSTTERGVLEEIVVTAQKRAESLQTVPIAVTAFSANQLTESNINGQIDLPKLTPNLNFTSNSGFASAYLRGVGTQFGNPGLEPSVSVYIDDTYIPRAGSAFFSLGDVNRIEVLKGPQGTLYGRNATGGAIRIITNDPTDKLEGKLEFTGGENGTRVYDGMLNVPLSDGIAVRFAASYDHNDGYVRNLNPGGDANGHRDGQNRDQQLYTAKLLMDRDGPWRFLLSADFSRKDDRESVSESNLFPGAPEQTGAALGGCVADGFYTYCNDGHDYLHTKAYGSTARLDYEAELFTLSSITGYRREYEYNCADIDATGAFVQPVCGAPATKQITQEFQV
ncbi:MAG: TonB-dependent receptor plug domain-containing protein, partial [Steroidobacteraceae bacterium]